ncbi:MAG: sugar ABC transporter substrate-binding protein [Thermoleophilaceae bacterium]
MAVSRLQGPLVALALAVSALLAACGEDDPADRRGPDAAGVEAARASVQRFRELPRFTAPGPAFDARRELRGKLVYEIPITSEVPFVDAVEQGMRQAAEEVGATLEVFPNQGEPSQWAQGIRTAIAREADAILLLAQDPELVRPQVEQAEAAGIPVVVLRTTGEGEPCPEIGTTCVPGPFEQAGRLEANFVIADSRGDANVLVITSNDARSTRPLVHGLRQEFTRKCAACDLRFVDVPIPDWAAKLRGEVQSALVRDPMIDYVIPIYDSMSQFAVPAILAAGASDRIKIATFNGTPFVLELIQDDEVVAMDAGENLAWVGWAAMDQAFRVIAGERPVTSERTPLRVFDAGNAGDAGMPPRFDLGYGRAYVDGYRELWGVSE